MEIPSRRVECDVLILGGGGAGLMAALEARKSVENVVVVSKRKPGRSGNTIVAASGFSAYVPGADNPDTAEQHLQDTLVSGEGINDPDLARTMVSEAGEAVLGLEECGVSFMRTGGNLVRRWPPGHTRPRQLVSVLAPDQRGPLGLSITLPMLKTARDRGVTLLSDLPVQHLLVRDGTVYGALALDADTGEPVALLAKSVILAAGGGGRLFANTNNTADMTGDAYALALEAGVPLRDMELVQFYPMQLVSHRQSAVPSGLLSQGATLRNRHGERFMSRYEPAGDMANRAKAAIAIFKEVQAGNGVEGGVYADCSGVAPEVLARYPDFIHYLRAYSVDLSKEWPVVAPVTHFLMGGAWADTRCRTGVEGLFAAGEAVGGTHGANRLAGNALTEMIVYGLRAGREAALHATAAGRLPEAPETAIDLPSVGTGSVDLAEVKETLRRAMWEHASLVRTEAGLSRARATLRECREVLPNCRVAAPPDVAAYLELGRMILVGETIVAAALKRKESRGAHWREDHPARDDARYLGSTRVERSGEGLRVSFVPLGES